MKQIISSRLSGPVLCLGVVCLLLTTISCGRKSGPKPPEAMAPSSVKFLTAVGTVNGVVLNWQAPDKMANGDSLIDLVGFSVKRTLREKDKTSRFEEIGNVPYFGPNGTELVAPGADSKPTPAPTLAPTLGLSQIPVPQKKSDSGKVVNYSFTDTGVQAGKQYEYLVVPVNENDVEGLPSGIIRVIFKGESSYFESFSSPEDGATSGGGAEELY